MSTKSPYKCQLDDNDAIVTGEPNCALTPAQRKCALANLGAASMDDVNTAVESKADAFVQVTRSATILANAHGEEPARTITLTGRSTTSDASFIDTFDGQCEYEGATISYSVAINPDNKLQATAKASDPVIGEIASCTITRTSADGQFTGTWFGSADYPVDFTLLPPQSVRVSGKADKAVKDGDGNVISTTYFKANTPATPTSAGNYTLKLTVSSTGAVTYSWMAIS